MKYDACLELNGLQVGTPTVSFLLVILRFSYTQHDGFLSILSFESVLFLLLGGNPSGRAVKMWVLNKIFFYCAANNSHILHISSIL